MIGKPTDRKIFWFDTETTGTDPVKNDILQLACIVEINDCVVEEKQWFMQPFDYSTIEQEALDTNHLDIEKIKGYMAPQKAYHEIDMFLRKYVDRFAKKEHKNRFAIGGYNVDFDINFYRRFAEEKNKDKWGFWGFFSYENLIDPLDMIQQLDAMDVLPLKLENHKLSTVVSALGVDTSNAHDAMWDIHATRDLYLYLREHVAWKS